MKSRPYLNSSDRNINRPTVQPTITTPSRGRNSITCNWSGGNATNYLVVAKLGNGVTFDTIPNDGTSYSPNSIFGSGTPFGGGYVVYVGSGATVTVSGLTSNTFYTFEIYGISASGNIYLTYTTNLTNKITTRTTL